MLPLPGFRCNMNSVSWSSTLIVSSCLITSLVSLASKSVGTAVDCGALGLLCLRFGCSVLGRLLLPFEVPSMPNVCICSLFKR